MNNKEKLCSQCLKKIFRKGYGAIQTSRGTFCVFCTVRQLKKASSQTELIILTAQKVHPINKELKVAQPAPQTEHKITPKSFRSNYSPRLLYWATGGIY